MSSRLLWSQEPISYEAYARDLARRIGAAFSRQELRELLREGLFLHHKKGRENFLRTHGRLIYRLLLTRAEKAFVTGEVGRWIACEVLEAEVLEAEGEEAAAMVREWGGHLSPYHFPSTECTWCYASLLDVVLRRREDVARPNNPSDRRPMLRQSNGHLAIPSEPSAPPQRSQPANCGNGSPSPYTDAIATAGV